MAGARGGGLGGARGDDSEVRRSRRADRRRRQGKIGAAFQQSGCWAEPLRRRPPRGLSQSLRDT